MFLASNHQVFQKRKVDKHVRKVPISDKETKSPTKEPSIEHEQDSDYSS